MDFTPDPTDPEDVLTFLARPIRAVAHALDDGASIADVIMADLGHDPYLWAHIARHRALQYLKDHAEPDEWALGRDLANSGIEIVRGPFVMRPLKTLNGGPPGPGHSRARRAFYSQFHQLTFNFETGQFTRPDGANLILDWTVMAGHVFLALSKPVGTWRYRGLPRIEWRRAVALDANDEPRFQGGDEDIDVTPRYDITELPAEEGEDG